MNTSIKNNVRQRTVKTPIKLKPNEQSFFNSLYRLKETGIEPDPKEAGPLAESLQTLIDAYRDDGLPGLNRAELALFDSNKRLALLRETLPEPSSPSSQPGDQPDQKGEQDARITVKNGRKVFYTMTEDEIDLLPDIEYLIDGILQCSTVSLLFGESNTGKTFNALHFAQCVARGMDWIGRRVRRGPVLYIYAEGKLGLKPRLRAWRKHFDKPATNDIQYLAFPVHLLTDRQTLLDTIAMQEQKPALVVVDTFGACNTGVNQNDQMEVTRVLMTAHEIVRDYSSHVLIVHHTNRSGTMNGSQAFKNHVDTMLELKQETEGDKDSAIIMSCEKQRDGEIFQPINLKIEVVEIGFNEETLKPITSCVVVAYSKPTREQAEQDQNEEKMLGILQQHKTLSTNKWKTLSRESGVPKSALYDTIESLKKAGKVTCVDKGVGKSIEYSISSDLSHLSQPILDQVGQPC